MDKCHYKNWSFKDSCARTWNVRHFQHTLDNERYLIQMWYNGLIINTNLQTFSEPLAKWLLLEGVTPRAVGEVSSMTIYIWYSVES